MKAIILTGEQTGLTPLKIIVRDKDVKELKSMQYSGGFKRFGIDIYDNVKKQKYTNYHKLSEWLKNVFPN